MKRNSLFILDIKILFCGLILFIGIVCSDKLSAQTIRTIVYRPNTIFTIKTGVGIATQIEINPREQVLDYGTGFSSAWEIVRRDNVFYIKPKEIDADTNMTIRTNKRIYLLELTVAAKRWKSLRQMKKMGASYHVKFVYPSEQKSDRGTVLNEHAYTALGGSSTHFDYDYSAARDSNWLVPQSVYDNGRFTFIQLHAGPSPNGGSPAVYGKKSIKGNEFVLNSKTEEDLITVFGIYKYLVLRHGNSVVGLRRNSKTKGDM